MHTHKDKDKDKDKASEENKEHILWNRVIFSTRCVVIFWQVPETSYVLVLSSGRFISWGSWRSCPPPPAVGWQAKN